MTDAALARAMLHTNFAFFAERVFETLNPGATYLDNWHLHLMAHMFQQMARGKEPRLITNVPPRSRKSELASVALPAYILACDSAARVMCVSYAQGLSSKHARDTRRVIQSDWYRAAFPKTIITKDTEEMIETTMGGCRIATSVGGTVTGLGARTIIIDDPIKPEDAMSSIARKRAIDFYAQTLLSRLDGDKATGSILLVQQRLHEEDLSGHLLNEGGWTHLCLPAIATEDASYDLGDGHVHHRKAGDLLHPTYESEKSLDLLKRTLGSSVFSAQYQQAPIPADGLWVKSAWLLRYQSIPAREKMHVTQSWDTAMKGGTDQAWSVCTTWGTVEGVHYLLHVHRVRVDFPDLLSAVVRLHTEWRPDALLIEDKGSGMSLIQTLRTDHQIWPIGINPTLDKKTRLNAVTPMFERGQVMLPADAPWLAEFEHELLGFPDAKFDDQVDSTSQYLTWARERGGFTLTFTGLYDDVPDPTMGEIADMILSSPRFF